ncbi:hypothetical protein JQ594_15450 [Bradyrhizobium manausense]|uniref:hypothetical protein n=1 Tax=Bradyrhizobium manausense TaxID=989370 RepID=UPI001BA8070E|nr:hypothetical protein [Bradyrhizobium manausense]MBR0687326.1 hypothetical protein [Bradyrhizobium manausense]
MVAYSFKGRFVDPIRVGLSRISLSYDRHPKRQTIRAVGKRRHARPGETLQLYCGMRSPQCFKIGEARCTAVRPILIYVQADHVEIKGERHLRSLSELDAFAQSDGFANWSEMKAFWLEEHRGKRLGPFVGILIQWEAM